MKPPPPMLPAVGCVTASANAVATAASTAVPPSLMTSAPMREAISLCEATMPFCARIGTELAPVVIVSADRAADERRHEVRCADYSAACRRIYRPSVSWSR